LVDVGTFLQNAWDTAVKAGVRREKVVLDPGIGFGKTFAHNLELLKRLPELGALGAPLLMGSSRKAFIRHLVKPKASDDLAADAPAVETGTQATVAAAIMGGAHIVRVHDVANTLATVKVMDAVVNA
jgi:dihydropteroate synthase